MGKAELKAGQSKNLNLRACNFSTQSLEENLRDIKNGFYLYFRKESFEIIKYIFLRNFR